METEASQRIAIQTNLQCWYLELDVLREIKANSAPNEVGKYICKAFQKSEYRFVSCAIYEIGKYMIYNIKTNMIRSYDMRTIPATNTISPIFNGMRSPKSMISFMRRV